MIHGINFEDQLMFYNRQAWIHSLLVEEYKKHGMTYGGRTYYTPYDINNISISDQGFSYLDPSGQGFKLNGSDDTLGSQGNYTKMEVDIHKKVLNKVYDELYKATSKRLLDKLNSIEVKGDHDLKKIVTLTTELIADLRHQKKWQDEATKILASAQKRLKKNMALNKQSQYLLTMTELEKLGRSILGRSTELCPIETGQLRNSGRLYVFNNSIRIIYECPYAIYQHENTNFRHAFGRDHFLQIAAQEMLHNIAVWTEIGMNSVFGSHLTQAWMHDENTGLAVGDATWVELKTYNTVYIDIDRNLQVNYAH